jgi:hypothetical protein
MAIEDRDDFVDVVIPHSQAPPFGGASPVYEMGAIP